MTYLSPNRLRLKNVWTMESQRKELNRRNWQTAIRETTGENKSGNFLSQRLSNICSKYVQEMYISCTFAIFVKLKNCRKSSACV